jgi:hypothetical protein
MYRVHRAHISALGPTLVAGCTGCSPEKAPAPAPNPTTEEEEGVLVPTTTPNTTPSTIPTPAKKVPSPNFVRLGTRRGQPTPLWARCELEPNEALASSRWKLLDETGMSYVVDC